LCAREQVTSSMDGSKPLPSAMACTLLAIRVRMTHA
jgi:hypothetical protein